MLQRRTRIPIALLPLVVFAGCGDLPPQIDTGGDEAYKSDQSDDLNGEDRADDAPEAPPGAEAPEQPVDALAVVEHRLVFVAMDGKGATYSFESSGPIRGEKLESDDRILGRRAVGRLVALGGRDVFVLEGELVERSLDVTGAARVLLDGRIIFGGPRVYASEGAFHSPKVVRISIHSSAGLLRRNGRITEEMVALHAARAFAEAGQDHEIVFNLAAKHPPDEVAVCSKSQSFPWWKGKLNGNDVDVMRKDSNVLLLDVVGGGCGAVTGNAATTAGRNIDQRRLWQPTGTDPWSRNIHGNLHEIGHNLGSRHTGPRHYGVAWHTTADDGSQIFHRTPNVGSSGAANACGTFVAEKQPGQQIVRHQTYSPCAAANFFIR